VERSLIDTYVDIVSRFIRERARGHSSSSNLRQRTLQDKINWKTVQRSQNLRWN